MLVLAADRAGRRPRRRRPRPPSVDAELVPPLLPDPGRGRRGRVGRRRGRRAPTARGPAPRRSATRRRIPPARRSRRLASPARTSPADGLTPIVVPNDRFYRIDTALHRPRASTPRPGRCGSTAWSTARRRSPTPSSSQLPLFEQYVTIACVCNEVGGNLVGNAKWTGVRLRDVLAMAGVQAGATQLVGRSVDGFTAGMPTAWVMDPSREPMIALEDERRAAAADPRLPGPADRPGPVRLRVGDEVADASSSSRRSRRSTATGSRSAGRRRRRS